MTANPAPPWVPDLLKRLRARAEGLPNHGAPAIQQARQRALHAVDTVAAALQVDPTLADEDRCRDLDLLEEILRQLKPLSRQAQQELARRRLANLPGTEREIERLGRTNPVAPDELDALSDRCVAVADRIRATALPDWHTPQRTRERSARLLPPASELADIAEQLRRAVRRAVELPHPDPEAVRLAALADQIARPEEATP